MSDGSGSDFFRRTQVRRHRRAIGRPWERYLPGEEIARPGKRASRLYDFLKIVVDDLMIVHGPCVERDISFFFSGRSVWK